MEKTLTKKEIDFCRAFAATNNPREAAAAAGYKFPQKAGLSLLEDGKIKSEIDRRTLKSIDSEEIITGLKRITFGSVSDAVRLVLGESEALCNPDSLDLFLVSEIKKSANGSIEIKFFDRVKAMDKLLELSLSLDKGQSNSFLDAILKGSEALNTVEKTDDEL